MQTVPGHLLKKSRVIEKLLEVRCAQNPPNTHKNDWGDQISSAVWGETEGGENREEDRNQGRSSKKL